MLLDPKNFKQENAASLLSSAREGLGQFDNSPEVLQQDFIGHTTNSVRTGILLRQRANMLAANRASLPVSRI
jgi:hypothetical protein